jgi:transglutaminase-like putative cysteine protease
MRNTRSFRRRGCAAPHSLWAALMPSAILASSSALAPSVALAPLAAAFVVLSAAPAVAAPEATYSVQHALNVKDIPAGAKKVRVWFWVPREDSAQKLLDFAVSEAPTGYKFHRDPAYGQQYLYCEVANPKKSAFSIKTDFVVRRQAITAPVDAQKSGAMTALHRLTFAEQLRRDTPHSEVTPEIVKLAGEICGTETNVVLQARKIYDYVVDKSEHYSKGEAAPKASKLGSVLYCQANGGGSCTDMHALFTALARARNIPTRLYFGSRLQAKNEGKEVDPGYRCSVEFFAPNLGWVPVDVAAGDTNADKKDFYFGGLDERRVLFNEGRDLDLSPKQTGPRLNLFIGAYVEVDGVVHAGWDRVMKFNEVNAAPQAIALNPAANTKRSEDAAAR